MRYDVGRFRRPMRRSTEGQLMSLINLGDGSTLTLDFTTGVLDPRLTFTRASGGTYTGNDGLIYGMDFATSSSLAIGTGSKTVTLTATAGVDRRYLVGQTIYISNGANNMSGPVTAYNASTQVLTINATATSGSGSFTSWTVGNASARFDYTGGAAQGLLIEGSSGNLLLQSNDWNTTWNNPAPITWDGSTYATAPDGTNTAKQITVTSGSSSAIGQAIATGTNRTMSVWLRAGTLTSFSIGAFDAGGTTWGNNADSTCRIISGPGSVTQQVGGLWSITGLSTTQWTRIQIFRSTTYTTFLAYPGSSSGTINGTAFMWGMQMEAGNGASSLIFTGASTATRNQDQMQMSSLTAVNFNTAAGTMLVNGTYNRDANAFPRSIRFMGSSVQSMAMITAGKTLYGNAPNTSGGSYIETSRTLAGFGAFKYGFTLTTAANPALATATVSLNGAGTTITPLGQGAITNPTTLDFLYGAGATSDYPSMAVSSLKYFPYAMTSAELNTRTT